MTDELHTEEDARMDALEDRTRALAARVETLTAERNTARASADRWHGVAHRMEEERDALRAQVDCGQDGVCAVAPGCTRHWEARNRELAAQVEQMRGDVERERGFKADIGNMLQSAIGTLRGIAQAKRFDREVFADDSSFVDWATSRARWEVAAHDSAAKALADRAALSPSPASADDCEHDTEPMGGGLVCKRCKMVFLPCPGCNDAEAHGIVYHAPPLCPVGAPSSVSALFPGVPLVPHEGPVTYEPKTTPPEPASGVAETEEARSLEFRFFKLLTGDERRRVLIDLGAIPDCEEKIYHSTERLFLRGLIQQGKAKEIAARLPASAPGKDGGR